MAAAVTGTATSYASKAPAGGAKSGSGAAPFALVSASSWNNPNSPQWCLNEDDYDMPTYAGALTGSYSLAEQLCGLDSDYYNNVYWDAGGIGLQSDVYAVGQLSDLAITAPDGSAHHGVLIGQTTSKGVTTYHYSVCYVPTYSVSTDTGGSPLPGGSWTLGLSGQLSSARWSVNVVMTDAPFQQSHCPSSQQSLAS